MAMDAPTRAPELDGFARVLGRRAACGAGITPARRAVLSLVWATGCRAFVHPAFPTWHWSSETAVPASFGTVHINPLTDPWVGTGRFTGGQRWAQSLALHQLELGEVHYAAELPPREDDVSTQTQTGYVYVEHPTFNQTLHWIQRAGAQGRWWKALKYLEWHQIKNGEFADKLAHNAAIRVLAENQQPRKALDLLRRMQRGEGPAPDLYSYSMVMHALALGGECDEALKIFRDMGEQGLERNVVVWTTALRACERMKRGKDALRLLGEMVAAGVQPNLITLNTALSALARCGEWDAASALLDEMGANGAANGGRFPDVEPDSISYGALLTACGNGGRWELVQQILSTMEQLGIERDRRVWNMAILAMQRGNQWGEGLKLMDTMREQGVPPDSTTYHTAMNVLSSAGEHALVVDLMRRMEQERIPLDTVSFNLAIQACLKARQVDVGMKLFQQMKSSEGYRCRPDLVTYNTVINLLGKAKLTLPALGILSEMRAERIRPDVVTYSSLISACEKAVEPMSRKARNLLYEMTQAGLRPNNVTYGSAILTCGQAGELDAALDLLQDMDRMGRPPNQVCFYSALTMCEKHNNTDLALDLYHEMQNRGLQSDRPQSMYTVTVRACEKQGRWAEAREVLEDLKALGRWWDETMEGWLQSLVLLESLAAPGGPREVDLKVVRTALGTCLRSRQWESSLTLLKVLEEQGRELPDSLVYGTVLQTLEAGGQWEQGERLFLRLSKKGTAGVDVGSLAAGMRCYLKQGKHRQVLETLKAAQGQGVFATRVMFQDAIRACAELGDFDEARLILDQLQGAPPGQGRPRPDAPMFCDFMLAAAQGGRWQEILRCVEVMAEETRGPEGGGVFNAMTVMSAINALDACQRPREADRAFMRAVERHVLPRLALGLVYDLTVMSPAAAKSAVRCALDLFKRGKLPATKQGDNLVLSAGGRGSELRTQIEALLEEAGLPVAPPGAPDEFGTTQTRLVVPGPRLHEWRAALQAQEQPGTGV